MLENVSDISPLPIFEKGANGLRTAHTFYTNDRRVIDVVHFTGIEVLTEPSDEIHVRFGNTKPYPDHDIDTKFLPWYEFNRKCISGEITINRIEDFLLKVELGVNLDGNFMPLTSESFFDYSNTNKGKVNYSVIKNFHFTLLYEPSIQIIAIPH
jgi:hypothetical protein